MRTEVEKCRRCENVAQQIHMGFLPLEMLKPEAENTWFRAVYCTSCDTLNPKKITQEELEFAEERFIHALVEHGQITEQEAKDILGID